MNLNHFYHYYKSKSGGVPNLLKATEDFDSSLDWLKKPDTDAPTITGGVTDPNGGTDAQRINFTANRQSRVQQSVTLSASTQYTFSVYARVNTGTDQFRLRNVTLSAAEAKTATTSWTRFEYTFTTTTGGVYELSIQNTENLVANIEFFGAMLNVGSSANNYVKVDPSTGGSAPTPAYSGFGDAFGGVTAYYSLRQFTEAETLNAIRVRRSSDDTEQDIGFDANGDLDTTALTTFVNADVDVYTSDFSSTENLSELNGTGAAAQSVGGVDDAYKFTLSGGNALHIAERNDLYEYGKSYTVSFDYYIPSGQTVTGLIAPIQSGNTGSLLLNVTGSWQSVSINVVVRDEGVGNINDRKMRFYAHDGSSATFNADGDVFYLKNIVVTQTTADGAVTTFYDQSGNGNHATNATASEQPLVVSGGTLVTENGKAAIDFDGTDDEFSLSGLLSGATEFTYISVDSPSATNVRSNYWAQLTDLSNVNSFFRYGSNAKIEIFLGDGTTALDSFTTASSYTARQNLQFVNYDSSQSAANQIDVFVNSTDLNASGSTAFGALNTIADAYIGSRDGLTPFLGKMQEVIVFNSDQSSNRTGIESNINDHFSIYP